MQLFRIPATLFVLMLALFGSPQPMAHSLGQTYLYLGISESDVQVRFEVTAKDLNLALGLDLPTDDTMRLAHILAHADRISGYLAGKVRLAPDGTEAELGFREFTIRDTKIAQYVLSHFEISGLSQAPKTIDIDYQVLLDEDPDQSGVLVVENDWRSHTFANEAGIALVFKPDERRQQLDLSTSSLWNGFVAMIHLGMEHILEGIDHVMFLIAILLPAVVRRVQGEWRVVDDFRTAMWHVIAVVTVFTIAHSITLSLAALEILSIPPRVVESVIAASIAIAALDVFYPVLGRRVAWIVFAFGLFHGAGFASVLLSMDIHPDYTVWTLLGFNLGVEIGQVAIVLVIFPILFLVRANRFYLHFGLQATAVCLITIALYWFIERAFEVDLPAGEYAQRLIALIV